MQEVVRDVPKSLATVNDQPFIRYLLKYLTGQGITKVILSTGYKGDLIRKEIGDQYKSIPVVYAEETEPLGTGGGILHAFQHVEGEQAFVMNGDSLFRIDFRAMETVHNKSEADITIALRELDDTSRYGTVVIDHEKRITGFFEKEKNRGNGYINGGIYLIRKKFMTGMKFPAIFSIEKDCFEKDYLTERMFGYVSRGYFLDIGIPDDYQKAQNDFKRFED